LLDVEARGETVIDPQPGIRIALLELANPEEQSFLYRLVAELHGLSSTITSL
jgi:hypothetical protein